MPATNAHRIPGSATNSVGETEDTTTRRWLAIDRPQARDELLGQYAVENAGKFARNIENYIGTINVPLGVAGPLLVHGQDGSAHYRYPLATTEAALVASYSRGCAVISLAGGCHSRVVARGLGRTPMFEFSTLANAMTFDGWLSKQLPVLQAMTREGSAHCRLTGAAGVLEGNHVYVKLEFTTGDASGQNMVTFAAETICQWLARRSPVPPVSWFLEANLSGDKKASAQVLSSVRGQRAVSETVIPRELVVGRLHTSPERMVDYWAAGSIGSVMAGAIGAQGHYANGLAALYLACGQDVACVAESAVGITRLSLTGKGDLYACVTLPNLLLATVGGGTQLPFAKASLEILGLCGPGNSRRFGEATAGLLLAGELSIVAALCSHHFADAHRKLARPGGLCGGQSDE
jgi:hydroxymethylglutaryl-CoA reductase (NADPH)